MLRFPKCEYVYFRREERDMVRCTDRATHWFQLTERRSGVQVDRYHCDNHRAASAFEISECPERNFRVEYLEVC